MKKQFHKPECLVYVLAFNNKKHVLNESSHEN